MLESGLALLLARDACLASRSVIEAMQDTMKEGTMENEAGTAIEQSDALPHVPGIRPKVDFQLGLWP